jgi:hypothetical protein
MSKGANASFSRAKVTVTVNSPNNVLIDGLFGFPFFLSSAVQKMT